MERLDKVEGTLDDLKPPLVRMDERLRSIATKEDVAKLDARVAKIEGAVERLPNTVQLGGFVLAVFIAAGVMRWVGG